MKHFLLIFCAFVGILSFAKDKLNDDMGITRDKAMSVVKDFYGALKSLPNVSIDEFYAYRDKKIYPLMISSDAFRHPNDIQPLVKQVGGENNWKYINAYMGNIRDYSRNNGFSMEFDVCDIREIREVEYENQKERSVLTYWEITVDKSFSINGSKYILSDTVDIKISNGKIAFISNHMYREASPRPKGGSGKEIEAWHNELIARAARYWSQGRKREAFDTYVKSVEDYEDPNTYFRIGVLLLYHRKECTNYNKKEARNLAYSYFYKARKLGHSEAYRVIDYFWGNYSGATI